GPASVLTSPAVKPARMESPASAATPIRMRAQPCYDSMRDDTTYSADSSGTRPKRFVHLSDVMQEEPIAPVEQHVIRSAVDVVEGHEAESMMGQISKEFVEGGLANVERGERHFDVHELHALLAKQTLGSGEHFAIEPLGVDFEQMDCLDAALCAVVVKRDD